MEKTIHYFENPGEENTDKVIELVKKRREELGIKHIGCICIWKNWFKIT